MSKGFRFEIYAIKKTTDYTLINDAARIQKISENLKNDSLWGWCEPVVKIHFDKFTEQVSLADASYASEEDCKSSPECESLKEKAIEELQISLNFVRRRHRPLLDVSQSSLSPTTRLGKHKLTDGIKRNFPCLNHPQYISNLPIG